MSKSPFPLNKRLCACGCENEFQPRRKDQIYLNSQHANFGYNHGKRKKKSHIIKKERILRKNDNILGQCWEQFHKEEDEAICSLELLIALGFNTGYYIGARVHHDNTYYLSHSYRFRLVSVNEIKHIKIIKL